MSANPDPDDLLLSDDERLHALNAISEHYAAGRLDSSEFYDRSGAIASARTLDAMRDSFRGLPGGLPLDVIDGHIRKLAEGGELESTGAGAPSCRRRLAATNPICPRCGSAVGWSSRSTG
ncbi:DUF1707 domain-containing protein [Prescottella defluvii]|nr:DUF1707 domain-containing protein [Prescottella defluvii]